MLGLPVWPGASAGSALKRALEGKVVVLAATGATAPVAFLIALASCWEAAMMVCWTSEAAASAAGVMASAGA